MGAEDRGPRALLLFLSPSLAPSLISTRSCLATSFLLRDRSSLSPAPVRKEEEEGEEEEPVRNLFFSPTWDEDGDKKNGADDDDEEEEEQAYRGRKES